MKPITIRFGGYQSPSSVHNKAAKIFGRYLTENLKDTVNFNLDGNVTTAGYKATDLMKMVENGGLDMCYISTSYLTKLVPEFALFDLPFIINDRNQAHRILHGPLGDILADKLATCSGYRLLGFWDNGFRHFTNRLRPIHEPADCRGIRIRALLNDLHMQVFRILGFKPIAKDVKELVSSLRDGIVDAQENPLTNFYNFNIYKMHRHITLSGHFFGAAALLCHNKAYASWPTEVRQIIKQAASVATACQHQFAAVEDTNVMAKLNPDLINIVTPNVGERALFIEAVAPIIDQQRKAFGNSLFDHITRG